MHCFVKSVDATLNASPLLTRAMIQNLEPVDRRQYEANMLGVNLAGTDQGRRR